jgi:phosphomannomutase
MRRSNTEPIVRIYSEAPSIEKAEALVAKVKAEIEGLLV